MPKAFQCCHRHHYHHLQLRVLKSCFQGAVTFDLVHFEQAIDAKALLHGSLGQQIAAQKTFALVNLDALSDLILPDLKANLFGIWL